MLGGGRLCFLLLHFLCLQFHINLFVFLVLTCCQEGACPSGWNSIGPGCYKFSTTRSTSYSDALLSCNSIGGKLFVPNSNDEWLVGKSTYVKQYIKSIVKAISPFWVGCTDQTVEGTFTCVDGTQLYTKSSKFSQILIVQND